MPKSAVRRMLDWLKKLFHLPIKESNMYDQQGNIKDRREMLKVKIKSLAEEARIIRKEEKRSHGQLRDELYRHRIDVVRYKSRLALLAYALIRGKDPLKGDPKADNDWLAHPSVQAMVKKFGPTQVALKKAA